MKYNILYKDILEIPNFLSQKECKNFLEIFNNLSESDWEENETSDWNKRNLIEIKNRRLNAYQGLTYKRVEKLFESYLKIVGHAKIQRMLPKTGGMRQHTDNGTEKNIRYGIVLYFNEDYVGGELVYPEIDLIYKPKSGSLIIHNAKYPHYVNEVTSGTRYMSTFFVFEDEKNIAKIKIL